MKRVVLVFVIIFVSSSYSQFIRSYGIKFGGTLAIQDNVILPGGQITRNDLLGLNIGAYTEFFNMPVFSLVSEVNYVQKGFKGNRSNIYYKGILSWIQRIDYLNISILGKTRIESEIISPYILLGPYVDFKLNESINVSDAPKYNYKNNVWGLKIGLGIELSITQVKILTEFLYGFGFEDVDDSENIEFNSFDFRIGVALYQK